MKELRSNVKVLIAQKSQRENRRISLRGLAAELGISTYTLYALADNKLSEYPKDVLEKLCNYFECSIGDLLTLEEIRVAA